MSDRAVTTVTSVASLRAELAGHRRAARTIAFVPTMGALHEGHARLFEVARERWDVVVASCFVNPTQFAPGEDLDRYPRTPEHDLQVAARAGVDVLWLPRERDIYGASPAAATRVHVGAIGEVLDGASRPGHFDGVATVVVRLLAAVAPDTMLLGRKDYQQVVVLRQVVQDLLLPVDVEAVATVREHDGLARSSRNAYLSPAEREQALAISAALHAAEQVVRRGGQARADVIGACQAVLDRQPEVDVEYIELVHEGTLDRAEQLDERGAVLLLAARIGTTRLIDNILLTTDHHEVPT